MKCDVIAAGIVNAAKGVSSSYVVLLTKKCLVMTRVAINGLHEALRGRLNAC